MTGYPLRNMDFNGQVDNKQRSSFQAPGPSDTPHQMRKIFIGGLPYNCTRDAMFYYFSQFGIIQDAVLMIDSVTKVSRGFGFVTFATEQSVHEVMLSRPHSLLGKVVDVKRAISKQQMQSQLPEPEFKYIYNTDAKLLITSIRDKNNLPVPWGYAVIKLLHEYFHQFGELEQIEENAKGERYIVFENAKAAQDVLEFNDGLHTYNLMKIQLQVEDFHANMRRNFQKNVETRDVEDTDD